LAWSAEDLVIPSVIDWNRPQEDSRGWSTRGGSRGPAHGAESVPPGDYRDRHDHGSRRYPVRNRIPGGDPESTVPEELPQFEEQYRQALRVAAETFSLDKLNATMECWRRIAWMTHSDPEAHRGMLDKARRILAGEQLPSVSAEEMRARLQERLGR
jgi:uncharacterized protein DUF6247